MAYHDVAAGMYLKDGNVFKVQISRSSGRPYALALVETGTDEDGKPEFTFDYDAAKAMRIMSKLSAHDLMTLEQAKEYGCLHGVCCVCGARLTNPTSIEAGIGPICAKGEQFANPDATKVYQTDAYREAAIAREEAQKAEKATKPAPARVLDAGRDKYGPVFLLSWSYSDDDFAKIKDTFKSFERNLIHQKWDGAAKVWKASATPDTVPVIMGLAHQFNFTVTPAAQNVIAVVAPGFTADDAVAESQSTPKTFAQLAARVG